ncbi:hypothetical protein FKM82_000576 [Ascaphus truei]
MASLFECYTQEDGVLAYRGSSVCRKAYCTKDSIIPLHPNIFLATLYSPNTKTLFFTIIPETSVITISQLILNDIVMGISTVSETNSACKANNKMINTQYLMFYKI